MKKSARSLPDPEAASSIFLLEPVRSYIKSNSLGFKTLSQERKDKLLFFAKYLSGKTGCGVETRLLFICTHNSRRSQMSQVWAQTAAYFYGVKKIHFYSGGTEATAFNPRAVRALRKAGFTIDKKDDLNNPTYLVSYSNHALPIKAYSKKFTDKPNPREGFVAVMTCLDADASCPLVSGYEARFSIPYPDPGVADNTTEEEALYDECCKQIALEMFFVFSMVKQSTTH